MPLPIIDMHLHAMTADAQGPPGARYLEFANESIEAADFLTDAQRRAILYDNAARFLRLSDAQIGRHSGRS